MQRDAKLVSYKIVDKQSKPYIQGRGLMSWAGVQDLGDGWGRGAGLGAVRCPPACGRAAWAAAAPPQWTVRRALQGKRYCRTTSADPALPNVLLLPSVLQWMCRARARPSALRRSPQ